MNHLRMMHLLAERLEVRASLMAIARQIYERSVDNDINQATFGHDWIVEGNVKEVCGDEPNLDKVGFDCDATFSCPSGFHCNTQFSQCIQEPNFSCSNDQYDCTDTQGGKNNTGEVYSCKTFSCTKTGSGDAHGFNCDEIDFFCGSNFKCTGGTNSFQCNSGHIFACTEKHGCGTNQSGATDSFSCNSTGYQGNGGYSEGSAGDFTCGWLNEGGPSTGTFDCNMTFKCEALSEFECGGFHGGSLPGGQGGGSFDCHSGDGMGGFSCGKQGSNFQCQNTSLFAQCQPGVDFNCASPFEYSGTPDPPGS